MELKNYNTYFFFLILGAISIFAFLILKPFLTAILVAAILAVIFQRPYQFFLRITGNRKSLSSLATSLMVVLIVIIPLFIFSTLIVSEVNIFYKTFLVDGDSLQNYFNVTSQKLGRIPIFQAFDVDNFFTQNELIKSFKNLSQGFFSVIQGAYQKMASFVIWVFAMFFALYYFLIDGKRAVKKLLYLSPLRNSHEKIIMERFTSMVRAVLKGVMIIGLIQGTIGGVTFAIAGVASPVIWGIIMFFFSLIPMVGTSLIWFPTGIIMLLLGNVWQGIFILSIGIGVISTVDNLIRPKLVGHDTQMHPLLVFFSTIGGIYVFGLVGFIIGPVLLAMCLSFWDIYAVEFKEQLKDFNV